MMSGRTIRSRWLVSVLGGVLWLSACSNSDEAATHNEPSPTKESAAMPVKDTVFGDMAGTMDRAREVEATTQEHKEALDRAIDQDSGSAPAE